VCRGNALYLFLFSQRPLRIFKTETKEQIAKDRLPSLAIEVLKRFPFGQLRRHALHSRGTFPFPHPCGLSTKSFQELTFSSPTSETEHVKHCWQDGSQFEILY
jgi:hypothetical protein